MRLWDNKKGGFWDGSGLVLTELVVEPQTTTS